MPPVWRALSALASASDSASAAATCDRCVRPWGKLPSASPSDGRNSSANRPSSLAQAQARSNSVACVAETSLAREALGEPERAGQEHALVASQAVVGAIAQDQSALGQSGVDRIGGAQHQRVAVVDEVHRGQQQQGSVEIAATEGGHEDAAAVIDAVTHDRSADRSARCAPVRRRCTQSVRLRQLQAAMHGHPAADLRMDEVTRRVADFPDAVIRPVPACRGGIDDAHQEVPVVGIGHVAALAPLPAQLEQHAVHVALELLVGGVADAHRPRPAPALEVIERHLGEAAPAVDRIHHLQRLRAAGGAALDEAAKAVGLGRTPEAAERAHREDRVADPAEAIVPVALAARVLGQRGRGRRDDRAGRREGQRLERDRRAHDRRAGMAVRAGEFRRPCVPPRERLVEVAQRGVVVLRADVVVVEALRSHVVQRHLPTLAGGDVDLGEEVMPIGRRESDVVADEQCGVAADGDVAAAIAGVVAGAVAGIDPGLELAVVEARAHVDAHAHAAGDAFDQPHQFASRLLAPTFAHGEEVEHACAAARTRVGCRQHQARVEVFAAAAVGPDGRHREMAAPTMIEQAREAALRVEARQAAPSDHPVARHEGGGVAVADQGMVADRRVGGRIEMRRRRRGEGGAVHVICKSRQPGCPWRMSGKARCWRGTALPGQRRSRD